MKKLLLLVLAVFYATTIITSAQSGIDGEIAWRLEADGTLIISRDNENRKCRHRNR